MSRDSQGAKESAHAKAFQGGITETSRPTRTVTTGYREVGGLLWTPREMEIVRRVLAGQVNKEIAADLNVSERTVKYYVSKILGKLGMAGRLGRLRIATWALKNGVGE